MTNQRARLAVIGVATWALPMFAMFPRYPALNWWHPGRKINCGDRL